MNFHDKLKRSRLSPIQFRRRPPDPAEIFMKRVERIVRARLEQLETQFVKTKTAEIEKSLETCKAEIQESTNAEITHLLEQLFTRADEKIAKHIQAKTILVKGEKGDASTEPGPAGYTPVKGKDYQDGKIPVLGVDYIIPEPVKGDKGDAPTKKELKELFAPMLKALFDEYAKRIQKIVSAKLYLHGGGTSGSSGTKVRDEVPSGSGTSFTLAHTPIANTLQLFRGGARQQVGAGKDYTISGTTITLALTLQSEEILLADYEYA